MCRNIKPLFNFEPAVNDTEVRASALQFVRKVSGYNKPSKVNEAAFNHAVEEVTRVTNELLATLVTEASPRSREAEIARKKAEAAKRFGTVAMLLLVAGTTLASCKASAAPAPRAIMSGE